MFSKLALFAIASMAVFIAAVPTPDDGGIQNSCNTGSLQCCNTVHKADSANADILKNLFNVGQITGQVGASCDPITVIGASGTSCSSQPVCCSNNEFNGVVVFGCSPFNFNA